MDLNVFTNNAYSTTELTAAIDEFETVPSMLGGMGIFKPKPVSVKDVVIEVRDKSLGLLGLVERGAPLQQHERGNRKKITLEVPKIGETATIWAQEIAGLRAFGSETENMLAETELGDRLSNILANNQATKEYMRLAAIQGKFLDPKDGSVKYDYYGELGLTEAAAIDFGLSDATTEVEQVCRELVIDVQRKSKGAWIIGQTRLHAMVGDNFWFALVKHPKVEKFYEGSVNMMKLKDLDPSSEFELGGIIFHRYVGTDDNSTVAIGVDEAKFFPVGANGVFDEVMAPADEFMGFIGTRGREHYALRRIDNEYENQTRWVAWDVISYPLFVCNMPYMLRKGIKG